MSETKTETKCRCGKCGWTGPESALRCGCMEIEDFWERVYPGEVVPDGECPECGGLAHAVDENEEANARLIAAAPELLASLSEIVRKSHLRPGQHEDCHVHPDLIARARAVLASVQQSA